MLPNSETNFTYMYQIAVLHIYDKDEYVCLLFHIVPAAFHAH